MSTKDLLAGLTKLVEESNGSETAAPVKTKGRKGNGKARNPLHSPEADFTVQAIRKLRQLDGHQSKGIHTRISGYNGAFKLHFHKDPIPYTSPACEDYPNGGILVEQGVIQARFCRKGVMLYLAGELPQRTETDASDVLASILR